MKLVTIIVPDNGDLFAIAMLTKACGTPWLKPLATATDSPDH